MVDSRDGLTQLYDRGSFDRHLRSSVGEANDNGEPIALVMADKAVAIELEPPDGEGV